MCPANGPNVPFTQLITRKVKHKASCRWQFPDLLCNIKSYGEYILLIYFSVAMCAVSTQTFNSTHQPLERIRVGHQGKCWNLTLSHLMQTSFFTYDMVLKKFFQWDGLKMYENVHNVEGNVCKTSNSTLWCSIWCVVFVCSLVCRCYLHVLLCS